MDTKVAKTYITKLINSNLSRYVDVAFFLRFILLMGGLYYFNVGYLSIVDARGFIYSSFIDKHLNYFSVLRASILHTANFLDHLFGVDSFVGDAYRLKLHNGHGIYVDFVCLGYGVMSFWIAFILAHNTSWQKKSLWAAGGVFFLWFLNSLRVALLLLAVNKHWNTEKLMDSHMLYNTVVYLFIVLMVFFYYKISSGDSSPIAPKQ